MFIGVENAIPNFDGYTLVVPCVAVGNVGQLAVDLLVSTLELKRAGYLYSDSLLPLTGNDPYAETGNSSECDLVTSVEVYKSEEKRLAVVQQRAPCVKGKRTQYVTELCKWIRDSNFSTVVILSSIFAHERRDKQLHGSPMRHFLLPGAHSLEPSLRHLGWQQLETRKELADINISPPSDTNSSVDQYYMPGSGMMREMCKQCEENKIEALCVLCFCAEGDNAVDGIAMASHLNTHFKWLNTKTLPDTSPTNIQHGWKVPSSWQLQYGSRFRQGLY